MSYPTKNNFTARACDLTTDVEYECEGATAELTAERLIYMYDEYLSVGTEIEVVRNDTGQVVARCEVQLTHSPLELV